MCERMSQRAGVLHAYAYGMQRTTMVSVEKLEKSKDWITRMQVDELTDVSVSRKRK